VFPILVDGRIVIPPGSYVAGTVTQVKRPGRVKGRAELYVRFDSLTLPNGVTRDFRARMGALDGRASEELDKTEGKILGEGNKSGDAQRVGEATAAGASVGAISGSTAGRAGMGAGIGAAAGATAGLVGVLMSRGPEAVLAKGTTLEMVLDRPLQFDEGELFDAAAPRTRAVGEGSGPLPSRKQQRVPMPGSRLPL
jgi:type IV secretion system protein VirB10